MLHPLRYKLNKTPYLPSLSLSPPSLSLSLSLSLSHSLFLRSSLLCLCVTLYLSRFPYSFPLFSARLHPSSSTFSPATRFLVPILSFPLRRTWIRSWLFAHLHERRSYLCHTKQLCNTCHASLTLSQFNTDNAIRQLA
ncbi:hypothetical protein NP493_399g03000 [Ridgeia piscesae]|uniref:Uncharacterized protein n=1 Tax=Ridgeia piscesae TaxID=27915 RepID=A0AAD9NT55_RIDPI|nr:hypothetical protein NP493_399g03000 [Ridgeia piscesae]